MNICSYPFTFIDSIQAWFVLDGANIGPCLAFCRFCIIEGPETVQDFAKLDLQEIQDNIRSRRNKIFLHMEEVC
jgi:hypothetical protein